MKLLSIVLATTSLVGCALPSLPSSDHFDRPNTTTAKTQADRADCEHRMALLFSPHERQLIKQCMLDRGYTWTLRR